MNQHFRLIALLALVGFAQLGCDDAAKPTFHKKYAAETETGERVDFGGFTFSRGEGNTDSPLRVAYEIIIDPERLEATDALALDRMVRNYLVNASGNPIYDANQVDFNVTKRDGASYQGENELSLVDFVFEDSGKTRFLGWIDIKAGRSSSYLEFKVINDIQSQLPIEWDEVVSLDLLDWDETRALFDVQSINPLGGSGTTGTTWKDALGVVDEFADRNYAYFIAHDKDGYELEKDKAIILDNDGIGETLSRNVDASSTGLSRDVVSNNIVDVGIQDGAVEVMLPYLNGTLGPNYRSNDNLHPLVTVQMQSPNASNIQKIDAILTFAGSRSDYTFSTTQIPSLDAANQNWEYTLLGPDDLADFLRTGHYEYDVEFTIDYGTYQRKRTIRGATEIVNLLDGVGTSEFGNRWWIAGLDRLVPGDMINTAQSAGDTDYRQAATRLGVQGAAVSNGVTLVRGDNTSAWYDVASMTVPYSFTNRLIDEDPSSFTDFEVDEWDIGTHEGGFNSSNPHDSDYLITTPDSEPKPTFKWRFKAETPQGGAHSGLDPTKRYQLFTTWVPDATRASNAAYSISGAYEVGSNQTTKTILVDQRYTPGELRHGLSHTGFDGAPHYDITWRSLGFYVPSTNEAGELQDLIVQLSTNFADGEVVADAVMLVEDGTYKDPPNGSDTSNVVTSFSPSSGSYATAIGVHGNKISDKYGETSYFDQFGRLRTVVDRSGNQTSYAYDVGDPAIAAPTDSNSNGLKGELTSITLQGGLTYTYAYSGGQLSSITDFNGRVTNFTPKNGSVGQVIQRNTSVGGTDVTYKFDYYAGSLLKSVTDGSADTANGKHTTQITYGSQQNEVTSPFTVSTVTNGDGELWKFTPFLVDGLGTTIHKPATGQIGERSGLGTAAENFDEAKAVYIDPRQITWEYQVDLFGLMIAQAAPLTNSDPKKSVWRWERNEDGLVKKLYEPAGGGGTLNFANELVTSYSYDAKGNLATITYAQDKKEGGGKITESWTYGTFSQVKTHTDGRGSTTAYLLDGRGNINRIDMPEDVQVNYLLYTPTPASISDIPGGLVRKVKNPRGFITESIYYDTDNFIGLVQETIAAKGTDDESRLNFEYDSNANPSAIVQQMSTDRRTQYIYDDLNQLIEIKQIRIDEHEADPQAISTLNKYDDGFLVKTTDALNRTTEYEYDGVGRLKKKTLPLETQFVSQGNLQNIKPVVEYIYDANGNLKKVTAGSNSGPGIRRTAKSFFANRSISPCVVVCIRGALFLKGA